MKIHRNFHMIFSKNVIFGLNKQKIKKLFFFPKVLFLGSNMHFESQQVIKTH